MSEETASRPQPANDIPEAYIEGRRFRTSQLIWLIPLVAAIVGLSLAVRFYLEQGPVITITFKNAEGIEPGKTMIKFKNVQLGLVKAVNISKDSSNVVVEAQLNKEAERLLVEDTRFWVVSARISGGNISGLGTLMGGSYIGLDAGISKVKCTRFTGLDQPPVIKINEPGSQFVLWAADIGSLDIGSPIYYRRLKVGEIIAYELDKDGKGVILKAFIRAPYHQYVKRNTLFWHASGIELNMNANGVKINTQSMVSIILGGIAFQAPEDTADTEPAASNTIFTLFDTKEEAFRRTDTVVETYLLTFRESVRGLTVGAPVDMRGVTVGEVSKISLDLDADGKSIVMPVEIRFYPERLRASYHSGSDNKTMVNTVKLLGPMVEKGLRAQLRNGNIITGQLYVALDFFPKSPFTRINWDNKPPGLPTITGNMEQLQTSLVHIVQKLEKLPLEELAGDARQTLQTLETTLVSADKLLKNLDGSIVPETLLAVEDLRKTLDELRETLVSARRTIADDAPLQSDLREALREMGKAAQSLRTLGDYLEQHPESLLRGKKEE